MVRTAKWLSRIAFGVLVGWEAIPCIAQQAFEDGPTPAQIVPIGEADENHTLPLDEGDEMPADENDDQPDDLGLQPADDQGAEDDAALDARPGDSESMDEEPANGEIETPDNLNSDGARDPNNPDAEVEVIRERYPSGSIRIEREVTQDADGNYINHGAWEMRDERGNLIAQGEFDQGNRTGTWLRWYRNTNECHLFSTAPYQSFNGPFISQATFKNGELDGTWTIWDAKQQKISQWEFVDGRRHGASIWWYAGGHKMRELHYVNGDIEGKLLEWNADGTQITNDTYQAGRKLAMKNSKHADGEKKSEGMYLFAKHVEATPDDWWSGRLQTTTKTGKDEKHGAWKAWHSNGQIQNEGTYEHDLQVGLFTWWHSNGQKALEGRFENGKQEGTWTWWHSNGQKSIYGEYARGNPTGKWTWWKENGKVAQSADLSHSEGVVVDTPAGGTPRVLPQAAAPKMKEGATR